MLGFAPLVYPASAAMSETAAAPGQTPQSWGQAFDWMDDGTPEEGNLGGAGNEMELYDTYQRTDDYEYADGSYGVLSWWDYGHHITAMGERIPVANPFQQNADRAANFLLSTNETQANEALEVLSDGEGTETRYVMVDWKMIQTTTQFTTGTRRINTGGKYFAPFQFYSAGNISQSDYYQRIYYQTGQQRGVQYRRFFRQKQRYYNSTAVRLYRFHGSAVSPTPIVLDWEFREVNGRQLPISNGVQQFQNMTAARDFVANDTISPITGEPTSQVGGFGPFPSEPVPALEHYRLVDTTNSTALDDIRYRRLVTRKYAGAVLGQPGRITPMGAQQVLGAMERHNSAWVKTFERVPGATVEGEGPPNRTVTASVAMEMPSQNSTFTYRQRAQTGPDGEFTMTLPYSTAGYEELTAEDGFTEPSVRATGPYTFTGGATIQNGSLLQYRDQVNVTESQVVGEDDSPVEVSLDAQTPDFVNQTADNGTADNGTTADGSTDGGTNETSSSESVAGPVPDGLAAGIIGAVAVPGGSPAATVGRTLSLP
jgi:dolichyl-diphosphooligosaccharide--protein glycosyltransferase